MKAHTIIPLTILASAAFIDAAVLAHLNNPSGMSGMIVTGAFLILVAHFGKMLESLEFGPLKIKRFETKI